MVTKLRKFNRSSITKLVLFVLIVGCITTAVVQIQFMSLLNINPETIIVESYKDSEAYLNSFYELNDEQTAVKAAQWEKDRAVLRPIAINFASWVVLGTLLLIYITFLTGRVKADDQVHLNKLDYIHLEFILIGLSIVVSLWVIVVSDSYYFDYSRGVSNVMSSQDYFSMVIVGSFTFLFTALFGVGYLSLIRRIKAGTFMKSSLIYKSIFLVIDFFKSLFDGRKFANYALTKALFNRQALFIAFSFSLVLMTFLMMFIAVPLMFFPPFLEVVLIYWFIKGNNKTFVEINKGFNDSLEEQMKAERMKIQLVTNVSHDLKTPLTSIISYVDLLSKEVELSEIAKDYISILADKSDRLKHIVSDLFDLAKSNSGNLSLELEELDLKKIIEQTLADMSDEIEKSGLQFKVKLPMTRVIITSDGKKLYRVFQNLVDNSIKYAMDNTRVFIDLIKTDHKAVMTIKNTAGYEMNFSAEDILQRFNRGDSSRSTEGSGLGLSIAESFTHACGGEFKIEVDGDLFKVTLEFGDGSLGLSGDITQLDK